MRLKETIEMIGVTSERFDTRKICHSVRCSVVTSRDTLSFKLFQFHWIFNSYRLNSNSYLPYSFGMLEKWLLLHRRN